MVKSTAGPGSNRVATSHPRRRSPGEGSVYRNGSRWRGALTWTAGDGTRHRRVVSADTSDAARDKLDALRRELKLGTIAPAGRTLTLGEYLAEWLERERVRIRPSTWRSRELHVRHYLTPALGAVPLARLTAPQVERALTAILETPGRYGRPRSPLTVRHARATLRAALTDAVRDGLTGRNAAADARPPRVPHRDIAYLTGPQVRRLREATRDDEYGPVYALAVSTGLRLGELLGLEWSDVDLAGRRLTVRRTLARAAGTGWALAEPKSTKSRRTIPLAAVAVDALRRQADRQDKARDAAGSAWQDRDGLVFTDAAGRPIIPESVSHAFHRARIAAGLPAVRFHDLRHSAATLLLAEGVPLAVVSDLLGHSGIAITAAHYAAIVPELRREAADAMDRALS